jgi:multidrug efflux pump subunit AcrB
MVLAIMASAITTVCVFVPVLLYRAELEMYGMMFQELILTVCVSLVVSLIVSVTLVPALAGSILKIYTRTQKPLNFKPFIIVDTVFAKIIKGLEDGYATAIRFCLKNRLLVLVMVFAIMIPSVQRLTSTGMNLTPSSQADDQININLTAPVGTTTALVQRYLFEFQEIITNEFPRDVYKTIVINTGGSNTGSIQINLPKLKDQKVTAREIQSTLTPYITRWSDVRITFSQNRGPGGGSGGVNIKVISDDTEAMTRVSNEILDLLKTQVKEALYPVSAIDAGSPRYEIRIDTDAASSAGVNVNTISALLKTAITGTTATTYHIGGDDVSIVVSIAESDLAEPADLGAISIQTANGLMTLDNFITYKEGISPQQIQREEGVRVNRVTASLAPGAIATEVQTRVEKLINENIVLPESVKIEYQGDARDIKRFTGTFILVILLAVFLVFCVMAAQFESLVDPFIIFASIPLLAIGVMAVYQITGQTISLYSLVGIVALVGIVVNNGIVLVDFTNQLVARKTPVFEACVEAGRNRLQPILMTTLTTVLGLVPIAFFPGEGAETMQPICMTIVGGLLSGAFMTLFVSPILYSLFNKRREKRFNDPESLMNQLEEVDEIRAKNIKVEIIKKD